MSAGTADPDPAGIMRGRDDGRGGGGVGGGEVSVTYYKSYKIKKKIFNKIKNVFLSK
jgi:hypothetical protein